MAQTVALQGLYCTPLNSADVSRMMEQISHAANLQSLSICLTSSAIACNCLPPLDSTFYIISLYLRSQGEPDRATTVDLPTM